MGRLDRYLRGDVINFDCSSIKVVSYFLFAGTVVYMTISGIWGGFAMIFAATMAQKKQ